MTTPSTVVIEWSNQATAITVCVLLIVAGVAALMLKDRRRWD